MYNSYSMQQNALWAMFVSSKKQIYIKFDIFRFGKPPTKLRIDWEMMDGDLSTIAHKSLTA